MLQWDSKTVEIEDDILVFEVENQNVFYSHWTNIELYLESKYIKIILAHFRELTEPECDRDITEFTTLQAQIRNQLEKIREQDITKSAGISRQNSWNATNQRHLEEKFIIKV